MFRFYLYCLVNAALKLCEDFYSLIWLFYYIIIGKNLEC